MKRRIRRRLLMVLSIIAIALCGIWLAMFQMPGNSYSGNIPPLSETEQKLQSLLAQDIEMLSQTIGPRNSGYYSGLETAQDYIQKRFEQRGYRIQQQTYSIGNKTFSNLTVEKKGTEYPDEIIVVGGHYDSAFNTPGANDNGTGTAATLVLADQFAQVSPKRTIRFVAFTNEEPPYFWTDSMGSLVYAKAIKQKGEKVVAMISLETMGYFSDQANSQPYPFPLSLIYPHTGNFISFISNLQSGYLVRDAIASFRKHASVPSEGASLPSWITGVGWSDQWSFWQQGYPGIMVTDTATYRYPHYHTENDTPDKIDYVRFTHVVSGLFPVILELANA